MKTREEAEKLVTRFKDLIVIQALAFDHGDLKKVMAHGDETIKVHEQILAALAPEPVVPDAPGKYVMTMPLVLAPCVERPKEWEEDPECRDCDMQLCISSEEEIYGCLYSFIKQGAIFTRREE